MRCKSDTQATCRIALDKRFQPSTVYHSPFNKRIIHPNCQRKENDMDSEKKDAKPEYPTMEQLARAILREPPAEWEYMKRGKKKKEKPE